MPHREDEAREALMHLMRVNGASCRKHDLFVRGYDLTSRVFYVVIACNGAERPVAEILAKLSKEPRRPEVEGIWVLSREEIVRLIESC